MTIRRQQNEWRPVSEMRPQSMHVLLSWTNGHFQTQIVVFQPPSLLFVQSNDPSMLCDRFIGNLGPIPLLVLLSASSNDLIFVSVDFAALSCFTWCGDYKSNHLRFLARENNRSGREKPCLSRVRTKALNIHIAPFVLLWLLIRCQQGPCALLLKSEIWIMITNDTEFLESLAAVSITSLLTLVCFAGCSLAKTE